MTLKEALSRARRILEADGVEDAPLEAELLLRHVLGINRTRLYQELDRELSPQDEKALRALTERRRQGEPTAYITGKREFYGREFLVNPHTLIPRPESELLVATALKIARHRPATIADIGTGCGAIAVTIALEIADARIYAADISPPALELARANCRRYGVEDRVILLSGDLLEPLPQPVDLIVANLPYVKEAEIAPGNREPLLALDGGAEGTESVARLCRQAQAKLNEDGSLLLEIGQGQSDKITALLASLFPGGMVEVFPDLSGIERVVSLSLIRTKVAR